MDVAITTVPLFILLRSKCSSWQQLLAESFRLFIMRLGLITSWGVS